ncbi:MAG: hypothetical protein ACOX7R_08310 [Acetivibrionales bacterium]|jgi:hypothetical protein
MTVFTISIIFVILIWALIYTVSYGLWTWRQKNILGALMVFFIAAVAVVLPVYVLFFIK